MNPTIILTTLRERFSAKNRWFSVVLMFALPLFYAYAMPQLKESGVTGIWGALLVWMLGAGIIGEEVSAGTLLLVLARPIRRWEYVLSKWIALAALTAAILALQALALAAIAVRGGQLLDPALAGLRLAEALLLGTGSASVLILFSVLVPGGKEVSSIMLAWAGGWLLQVLGPYLGWMWLFHAGEGVVRLIYPTVSLGAGGGVGTAYAVLTWAMTTAVTLLAAVVAFNRRELSYAAG